MNFWRGALALFLLAGLSMQLAAAANPGHTASAIGSGTFESGDYTFPNNLVINGNLTLAEDPDQALEAATKQYVDNQVGGGGTSGWNDTGTQVELITNTDNVSANTLFVDNTNGEVGIGNANPANTLDVSGGINADNALTTLSGDIKFVNSNHGISNAGGDFKWYTNGVTRVYIDANNDESGALEVYGNVADTTTTGANFVIEDDGNVGIGTTNPGGILHVQGGQDAELIIQTDAADSNNEPRITFQDSSGIARGKIYADLDTDDLTIDATSGNDIYLKGGNVGIGTTGPSSELTVSNGTVDIDVNPGSGVGFLGTNSNHPLALITNNGEKVRIQADGNVGIGETSPSSLLHLGDAEGEGIATLGGWDNTESLNANANAFVFDGPASRSAAFHINGNDDGDMFYVATDPSNGNNADTIALSVINSGNVGIGTSTPENELEINSSTHTAIGINSATNETADIKYRVNGANKWQVGYHDINNHFRFHESGQAARLVIEDGGNVGIGNTGPNATLHITGNAQFDTQDFTVSGSGLARVRLMDDSTTDDNFEIIANSNQFAIQEIDDTQSFVAAPFKIAADTPSNTLTTTSGGNVGIGTADPNKTLHVTGTAEITEDALFEGNVTLAEDPDSALEAATKQYVDNQVGGSGNVSGEGSANHVAYWDSTSTINHDDNQLYWDPSSNELGIGTNSPDYSLHVYDTATVYQKIDGDSTDANAGTIYENDATRYTAGIAGSLSDSFVIAQNSGFGSNQRLVIDTSGNVGVGTVDPNQTLHVVGKATIDGGAGSLSLKPASSDHTYMEFYADTAAPSTRSAYVGFAAGGDNTFTIDNEQGSIVDIRDEVRATTFVDRASTSYFLDPGATGDAMAVAGDVAIRTTSASEELHIRGADNPAIRLQEDGTSDYFQLEDNGGGVGKIARHSTTGNVQIDLDPVPDDKAGTSQVRLFRNTNTTGTKALYLYRGDGTSTADARLAVDGDDSYLTNTDFGIGDPTPDAKLDVAGNIQTDGNVVLTGSGDLIDFSDDTADKIHLWGSTYGIGVSSNEFNMWSNGAFSWRQSSRTGTEIMNLDGSGNLQLDGTLTVSGSSGTINGATICTSANGECAGQASAAGWQNTSTTVSLVDTGDIVDANTLYVDNPNGEVGIGDSTPDSTLDVAGNVLADNGNFESNHGAGGIDAHFRALTGGTKRWQLETHNDADFVAEVDGTDRLTIKSSGNVRVGGGTPGNATGAGDLYVTGDIEYDGNLYGPGADIAEIIPADQPLAPGTVVSIADGKVEESREAYDQKAAGVVTTDPGITLSKDTDGAAVALAGRVPVRVTGHVAAGEPLVPAGDGKAMALGLHDLTTAETFEEYKQLAAENERRRASILGKALESGSGVVEVLVQ